MSTPPPKSSFIKYIINVHYDFEWFLGNIQYLLSMFLLMLLIVFLCFYFSIITAWFATSLATPNPCKIQNGHQGAPKIPQRSYKALTPWILGAVNSFYNISFLLLLTQILSDWKIQKGYQGVPKWPRKSWNSFTYRFLGTATNFCEIRFILVREGFQKKQTTNLGFWLNLRWHLPTFRTWAPLTGAIFLLV